MDPICPFDTRQYKNEVIVDSVPLGRILEKLDVLYDEAKYAEALRLIRYWIAEAQAGKDKRGELTLTNEMMGFERFSGHGEAAVAAAERALELLSEIGFEENTTVATTYVNCATVYKAFGQSEKALPYYEKARELYEKLLDQGDDRLGALYNNMALALVDLGREAEARELYEKALVIEKALGNEENIEKTLENMKDMEGCPAEGFPEPEYADSFEDTAIPTASGMYIAKKYYEDCFKEVLERDFADIKKYIAVGLSGSGSECYGFDDEISRDHDFEPGFTVWIPGEELVSSRRAFELQRAYDALPKEFMGLKRNYTAPVGGRRHGVIRLSEFIEDKIGSQLPLSTEQWLSIPSYALCEAVNGKIFEDNYGEIARFRANILRMPKDVRLKRIAGNLLLMAQSGQYNVSRCIKHGEKGAAGLAMAEFVKAAVEVVFLLNGLYSPYYKWCFRAMKALPRLSDAAQPLEYLISAESDIDSKLFTIEEVCYAVISELKAQGISKSDSEDLEQHAYSVNDAIADAEIRNMNILCAV